MKNLQNNFTTLEQSERLLELGVPADSADMYIECYWYDGHNGMWRCKIGSHEIFRDRKQIGEGVGAIRPCWSVGRLIEIILLCPHRRNITISKGWNPIESLINQLVMLREVGTDFSKLEE